MGRRKKKAKKGSSEEPESVKKAPHSFVIKRGKIGKNVNELMQNFRQVLEPYTAMQLKVKKYNVVKDFVHIASSLNVTHLIIFTKTMKSAYLRLCRVPRGPTLTFKIVNYTLTKDVRTALRKPLVYSGLFQLSPLLVLNGFSSEEELKMKLMTSMWRNLLPSIDVNKVNLNTIRRCILLNFNQETQLCEFRHYAIKVKPVGLSRAVRKLIAGKKIPDLGKYNDVTEMMGKDNAFTESEGEADEVEQNRQITLPQKISSRGNMINEKSAIRLIELGPRMTLQLFKIEEGIMNGEVMYHSVVKKTQAEVQDLKREKQQKTLLKLSRKRQQELNVKRKMAKREKEVESKKKQNQYDNVEVDNENDDDEGSVEGSDGDSD